MSPRTLTRFGESRPAAGLFAGIALFAPAGLLGIMASAASNPESLWLWSGAGVSGLLAVVLLCFVAGRPLRSPLTGMPCLVAVVALWLTHPVQPFALLTLGLLVLVPVWLFAAHALFATGAPALRQARKVANRLAARSRWPEDLAACQQVPEVRALRDALREEAAAALPLLDDARPAVRIAALAALEFRRGWRVGQPDRILRLAKTDPLPEVRAAAVMALGGVRQRFLLEELAGCLRDPAPAPRHAAVQALLWDCQERWILVRHAVHEALADPRLAHDGPLAPGGAGFNEAAAADLAAWAGEAGALGTRATQTLALHYNQRLAEHPDPKLLAQLRDHVASTRASAVLRIELAQLLQKYGQFTPELLERMIDPANPSPLRLLAVEAMLKANPDERAVAVLRDIARQPNRELALHAAVIVQKYLQVDLGLALGEAPPALHTRQAAEVTRRVIHWAAGAAGPLPTSSMARLKDSVLGAPARQNPPSGLAPSNFAPLEWD